MENTSVTTPTPKPNQPNKLLRLGRKILIGAVIMFCLNFFLKLAGWESWEKFSKQADNFAENLMDGALRLSPLSLWNSINTEQHTYTLNLGRYFSTYQETGKVTLRNKVLNWLGYYWFTPSGKAFWIGRLLLIAAFIFGISIASDDYKNVKDKTSEAIIFLFVVLLLLFFFFKIPLFWRIWIITLFRFCRFPFLLFLQSGPSCSIRYRTGRALHPVSAS